jgi:ABC-type dipeptide/oligopeptide/nickel transport system permease component
MTKFIVRRLLWMALVLFVVSLITFGLMNAIPGGPFDSAGERPLPPEIIANIEARYGLNDPLWFRYVSYIGGVAIPKFTYGEWQYKLTLDREDAGMEVVLDEEGEEVPLSWPQNILTGYQEESVIDSYLINIPMPFVRREVPVSVRDTASAGGSIIGVLDTGGTVEVLRINSRETYYQVQVEDAEFEGETNIGWVPVNRLNVSGEFSEENPGTATITSAPGTLRWMNFGPSYASRSTSVNDLFQEQLIVSAQLGVASIIISAIIGIPLGVIAGLNRNTGLDYFSMGVAILGVSVPVIVLGPVLRYVAVQIPWLPVSGWGSWQQVILPAFALGFAQSALLARLTRASMLQVLNEDYIRTARAKGLSEQRVIVVHTLKNSMIPVVTVLGPLLAALVTGSFVTETIFAIPGIGRYFITSVTNRDYPVIMGTILMYAFFLVLANMIVDIVYALLDPRIRYT